MTQVTCVVIMTAAPAFIGGILLGDSKADPAGWALAAVLIGVLALGVLVGQAL